jgi:ABC-type multidrug transport system ATPase subunit
VILGVLTVKETLAYASRLRMNQKHSDKFKSDRVNAIMDMLGLSEHCDTIVGTEHQRGISGGQLKRL